MLVIKIYADTQSDLLLIRDAIETSLKPIPNKSSYLFVMIESHVFDSEGKSQRLVEVHNSDEMSQSAWAIEKAIIPMNVFIDIIR